MAGKKIRISYSITEEAQKKLLAEGKDAKEYREIEVEVDDELLFDDIIKINSDGRIYLANYDYTIEARMIEVDGIKYKKYEVRKKEYMCGFRFVFDHIPSESEILEVLKKRSKKYNEALAEKLTKESYEKAKIEHEEKLKKLEEKIKELLMQGNLYYKDEKGKFQPLTL